MFFLLLWDWELGKIATKLEFWEISHFNKPFRLEVCLRYFNNYNNKWMSVLSIGEIKYMITLHKKNILQIIFFFFYKILDWEIFQAILEKFRGNSDWDWGRISARNRVQKKRLPYHHSNTPYKLTTPSYLALVDVHGLNVSSHPALPRLLSPRALLRHEVLFIRGPQRPEVPRQLGVRGHLFLNALLFFISLSLGQHGTVQN